MYSLIRDGALYMQLGTRRCSLHTAWYETVQLTCSLVRDGAVDMQLGTRRCSLHCAWYGSEERRVGKVRECEGRSRGGPCQ
jgi:hypothetical protein